MTDYQKQANDFLAAHGLEFRSVLVGDDCPRFCEDGFGDKFDSVNAFPRRTHIHGKHYRCTVSGKDRGHVAFDFWNSYADEEHNHFRTHSRQNDDSIADMLKRKKHPAKTPTAYDLFACIQKSDPGIFQDFCSDFGYSDDSIKAFETYRAAQDEYCKVRRFFTAEEIEALQEIS